MAFYKIYINYIHGRTTSSGKDCHYVYHFTNSHDISLEFISRLYVLGIDFNYNNNKYENFSLEYNIVYYPMVKEVQCINNCTMQPSTNMFASILKSIFG